MSQQWRILVVEGDEALNRGIVSTLSKDGYSVQGVATGGEAIRVLWTDEQHLVISDRTLPDADGFELLQWIRSYRPETRMMMLAAANARGARTQALENGAVAYLEKPVDLRLLKVEVRRLLQQSGFTASLASFDLLDVIQIVNMSRKSIALVVHTGLEEQGLLGFKSGELIWAEYGFLRGEEAFFALAAYKNGTVTQQSWNDAIMPNVTQPLSRLILQALQYRSKYASAQQLSGEYEAVSNHPTIHGEDATGSPFDNLLTEMPDDSPFVYVAEELSGQARGWDAQPQPAPARAEAKEWWQESAKVRRVEQPEHKHPVEKSEIPTPGVGDTPVGPRRSAGTAQHASITPSTVRKTPTGQRNDLPSWLMDQPTQFEIQAVPPPSQTGIGKVPGTPEPKPTPAEWQPPQPPQPSPIPPPRSQPPVRVDAKGPNLQSLATPRITDDLSHVSSHHAVVPVESPATRKKATAVFGEIANNGAHQARPQQPSQDDYAAVEPPGKRNYQALVAALQTLGYALPGFLASAVVSMEGQPIAQVTVDDLDIVGMCPNFSVILRAAMRALDLGGWQQHEDTIITSGTHHILLRALGSESEVFQVLITSRESDPVESLEVMANVEGAIIAAL